jgi:hypothetical protein
MSLTITELREDLLKVYADLRSGVMDSRDAKQINNTAGKIIASAKVQIEYSSLRNEKPDIDFIK